MFCLTLFQALICCGVTGATQAYDSAFTLNSEILLCIQ